MSLVVKPCMDVVHAVLRAGYLELLLATDMCPPISEDQQDQLGTVCSTSTCPLISAGYNCNDGGMHCCSTLS